jgi:hypothetical protein
LEGLMSLAGSSQSLDLMATLPPLRPAPRIRKTTHRPHERPAFSREACTVELSDSLFARLIPPPAQWQSVRSRVDSQPTLIAAPRPRPTPPTSRQSAPTIILSPSLLVPAIRRDEAGKIVARHDETATAITWRAGEPMSALSLRTSRSIAVAPVATDVIVDTFDVVPETMGSEPLSTGQPKALAPRAAVILAWLCTVSALAALLFFVALRHATPRPFVAVAPEQSTATVAPPQVRTSVASLVITAPRAVAAPPASAWSPEMVHTAEGPPLRAPVRIPEHALASKPQTSRRPASQPLASNRSPTTAWSDASEVMARAL